MLSQFTPEAGHEGLGSCIQLPGLYPAGRLDHDSEGLLLLTSDGALAHRLTDPRQHVPKRYWAQVEGVIKPEALEALAKGVIIQGRITLPAEARMLAAPPLLPERTPPIRVRQSIPTAWMEVVLREGRNRQVRRMTASVGLPTLRLIRVSIGPVQLGDLPPGAWRALSESELQGIWSIGKGQGLTSSSRRTKPPQRSAKGPS